MTSVPRRRPPEHDQGIAAYLLERRGAPGDAEQRRLDRRVRDWLAGVPALTRPAWAR